MPAKPKSDTITLVHASDRSDGTLTVDEREYAVTGGVVHVAPEDYEAALQAGDFLGQLVLGLGKPGFFLGDVDQTLQRDGKAGALGRDGNGAFRRAAFGKAVDPGEAPDQCLVAIPCGAGGRGRHCNPKRPMRSRGRIPPPSSPDNPRPFAR